MTTGYGMCSQPTRVFTPIGRMNWRAGLANSGLTPLPRHTGAAFCIGAGWIWRRASVLKDDRSILEDCERGEQTTIKHYDHALECELPEEVRAVVERQRADVDNWVKRLHVLQSTT
jgi:hypothetical protein